MVIRWFFNIMVGVFFTSMCYAGSAPEGIWSTIDKQTGERQADIEFRLVNDELRGTIIRPNIKPGGMRHCQSCPGQFKNQPIEGIEFIWGLHDDGRGGWDGGRLLDPRTGKIYRVKVVQHGNQLHVRGYIGVSWLGQTEVWVR